MIRLAAPLQYNATQASPHSRISFTKALVRNWRVPESKLGFKERSSIRTHCSSRPWICARDLPPLRNWRVPETRLGFKERSSVTTHCSSRVAEPWICARDLPPLRNWRVSETKLGFKERSSVRTHCSSRVAERARDLEERFGQVAGVKFVDAAGYSIVEMRLNEGSSCRVVLQSALVASYKSRMWHGGVEELLYTAVVQSGMGRMSMLGGVAIRIWEHAAGSETNLLAETECWHVENVRSNPSQFVQITLSTTSKSQGLQFKYVFTLTEAALSCALITTNVGSTPLSIHGSFQTSVAVNFVDGAYALGLQGYKYQSPGPPNSRPEPMDVEKEQMVRMKGGIDRLYTELQNSVSLLDRGKRRTVNFHSTGFEDVRLSNPGEQSGLEDWDSFVCIELAQLSRPVHLQPGQEWRAAKQLENPSK